MNRNEKLERIKNLGEKERTQEVLIPLFEKMGFKNVEYNHGVLEYGKDIICCKEDEFFNRRYIGVQVKVGDINTALGDKIFNQISEGFGETFVDLSDGKKKKIDKFIVLTSEDIKEIVKDKMFSKLKESKLDRITSFINGNKLIDLLDEYIPSVFWKEYGYFKKYCNAMKKDFETIKDTTAALCLKELIPLNKIWVSLKLVEKVKEHELVPETEALKEKGEEKLRKEVEIETEKLEKFEGVKEREEKFDTDEVLDKFRKVVIVGAPGSGKTTLLRHLALKSIKENIERVERKTTPVPITLRELSDSEKNIRDYIDSVFKKYDFSEAEKFIEGDLKAGKCLLLFDGFDELASKKKQDNIIELIEEFIEAYPKNQVMVTSRIAGYHDELNFPRLELMEFSDEQIKEFIYNWFSEENTKAESMHNAVMWNESVKDMARNPLRFPIIGVIYEEDKELPQRRVELYKRCVEVLLSKWDQKRRIRNKYDETAKEQILKKLAVQLHTQKKRTFILIYFEIR